MNIIVKAYISIYSNNNIWLLNEKLPFSILWEVSASEKTIKNIT